jgi:hypothetical protein
MSLRLWWNGSVRVRVNSSMQVSLIKARTITFRTVTCLLFLGVSDTATGATDN